MQVMSQPNGIQQASQPMQNQSQTAFFDKRNRSRGIGQQQLITNPPQQLN
jgi:hypothetical protein